MHAQASRNMEIQAKQTAAFQACIDRTCSLLEKSEKTVRGWWKLLLNTAHHTSRKLVLVHFKHQ
jgi:hypothetical protein